MCRVFEYGMSISEQSTELYEKKQQKKQFSNFFSVKKHAGGYFDKLNCVNISVHGVLSGIGVSSSVP